MNIYLIRHTIPQIKPGVCYGQTDLDVAESFPTEVASLRQRLKVEKPVEIWSSPLQRCRKLADAVADLVEHTGSIREDNRLKELHFGAWEMKSYEQIGSESIKAFRQNLAHHAPPDGESFHQLQERVVEALQEIEAQAETDALLTVHAGVIRAVVSWVLGFPIHNLFQMHVEYAGITRLRKDRGQWKVVYMNQ